MKNSYLALMYDQTPLNTLQMSFLLISQQRCHMGTIILMLQIGKNKKKKTKSWRFKCHVQASLGGSEFPSPVSMTAVSTD